MILLATALAARRSSLARTSGRHDTFTDVAVPGSPNLATMAPGVSAR